MEDWWRLVKRLDEFCIGDVRDDYGRLVCRVSSNEVRDDYGRLMYRIDGDSIRDDYGRLVGKFSGLLNTAQLICCIKML